VGTRGTTRCCSAVALIIAITALMTLFPGTIRAQTARPAAETPLSLFPIRTVWTLPLNNQLIAPPAYFESHAYFAIEGDRLVAYELERGTQEWIVPAHPVFEPAVGDGLLFLVQPTSLTALHSKDGTVAWQLPPAGELSVRPVWDNGWLVLVTRAGEVLAFRAIDGHLVWRRDLGSAAHADPSFAADRVYVALEDGRIVALRVDTGDVAWEHRLAGPATGLLALDDRLYAGSTDNFFYALHTADGKFAWRWRTGADLVGTPVVDDRNVYFVSLDNVLRALSRKTGVQQWVRLLPLRPTRGPLNVDRTLVISGVASTLRGYNMKDGTPGGEVPGAGEPAGSPYARPGSSEVLVVTRDIAKGATATLFVRQIGPPLNPLGPLPNASKATFLDVATPAVPEP
jgi:outer membrane protein assembly factor BamB